MRPHRIRSLRVHIPREVTDEIAPGAWFLPLASEMVILHIRVGQRYEFARISGQAAIC